MNIFAKAIGLRWIDRDMGGWNLRFNWAEVSGRAGFALALCSFEEHYSLHVHLGWPNIFFRMPFLNRWHHEPHEGMESWGFSIHARDAHLNWGRHYKIVHFPWSWTHVRHDVFDRDGKRRPWLAPWDGHDDGRYSEVHPYTYILRSGEVQKRTATIFGEEREWRWLWFRWLPWPRMIRRSIDIKFDDEVGERTGSWKGGCLGCGYDWRRGETMLQSLRRMEAERKFR